MSLTFSFQPLPLSSNSFLPPNLELYSGVLKNPKRGFQGAFGLWSFAVLFHPGFICCFVAYAFFSRSFFWFFFARLETRRLGGGVPTVGLYLSNVVQITKNALNHAHPSINSINTADGQVNSTSFSTRMFWQWEREDSVPKTSSHRSHKVSRSITITQSYSSF